jgi:hypothetical protein
MIYRLGITLSCLFVTLNTPVSQADWQTPKSTEVTPSALHTGRIVRLGWVLTRIDQVGEPISEPIQVSVSIQCTQDEKNIPVFSSRGACEWTDTSVDLKNKKVRARIKLFDPKTEKCALSKEWIEKLPNGCK